MLGSSRYERIEIDDDNPLDIVEDIARAEKWAFTRHDDNMVTLIVGGQKTDYELCMEWQGEFSAVLFACVLPLEISDAQHEMAVRALEQINQNIWMGHFDLSTQGRCPTYRYTLLCRTVPVGLTQEAIEDVLDIAIAECNRFYTTFQLVQAGDIRLQDNLQAAVFETLGEA